MTGENAGQANWQAVSTADGAFDAYWVGPEDADRAIILLQEIFGVNRSMRKLADWLAGQGYLVAVPDLYWRMEPHIELGYAEEEIKQALAYSERLDGAKAVEDISATVEQVRRARPDLKGVHLLGLCLGGKLAVMGAAEIAVTSAVVFYGVGIEKDLGLLERLKCPVQMHFGDKDRYVSADALKEIVSAPHSRPVEVHVYEGVDHGFFNPSRVESNTGASALAWTRARAFLTAT